MIKDDCVGMEYACDKLAAIGYCPVECSTYEQDTQIARDNNTAEIATREPDYEKLFKIQSVILVNHFEEISKIKHDNNLMHQFILSKGLVME